MNDTTEEFRARRLDEVSRLVTAKVAPDQRATLQAFIERYYGQVDPEDLLERQPADLYGAALSHWNFARKRESGRVRVRVFNPSIHVEGDRTTDTAAMEALAIDITRVLDDVRAAVDDWQSMQTKARTIAANVATTPPPLPGDEIAEGVAFINWLADNHFTFLGYRCHDLVTVEGQDALQTVPGSSLGILRETRSKDVGTRFAALPPEVRAYARRPELLIITKSTSRSTVHRPGFLDYIAIKRFNEKGEVCGEDRFLGLFTSAAYSAKPSDIPLLRHKTSNVIRRAHL